MFLPVLLSLPFAVANDCPLVVTITGNCSSSRAKKGIVHENHTLHTLFMHDPAADSWRVFMQMGGKTIDVFGFKLPTIIQIDKELSHSIKIFMKIWG